MHSSKVGIAVYASDTGLGNQTRLLHKLLAPTKTMLIDLSVLNHMPLHEDWYPQVAVRTRGFPSNADVDSFLDGLDAVFLCETPLNYYLLQRANQLGIAVILQYNYEFCDFVRQPHLPRPTVFAGPTLWNKDRLQRDYGIEMTHLPLPVDIDALPQRTITQARHFFHIAGRPAVHDRNGTLDFIKAVRMLNRPKDVTFTIYCQRPTPELRRAMVGTPIQLVEHLEHPADLYKDGDVMIYPRRYGGLALPLNEAIGSGIPVIMPDVDPNNTWLPREWLVPASPRSETFMAHAPVDLHSVNVAALAQRMSDLYRNPELVSRMHAQAQELAAGLSWSALQSRYEEVIEEAASKAKLGVAA